MGRPPKPTNLLQLTGAFKKNPKRGAKRANEPKPEGPLGDPPARFLNPHSPSAVYHLEMWHELIGMAPIGVLTSADRWAAELACVLMAKVRYGGFKGGDVAQLSSLMGKMGLTPSDRSRVFGSGTEEGPSDSLGAFIRKKKTG